jgi:hypothetical protein
MSLPSVSAGALPREGAGVRCLSRERRSEEPSP